MEQNTPNHEPGSLRDEPLDLDGNSWSVSHQHTDITYCSLTFTAPSAPLRAPDVPLQAIEAMFYELGPIPRLCFGPERLLIDYRKSLNRALDRLSLSR